MRRDSLSLLLELLSTHGWERGLESSPVREKTGHRKPELSWRGREQGVQDLTSPEQSLPSPDYDRNRKVYLE